MLSKADTGKRLEDFFPDDMGRLLDAYVSVGLSATVEPDTSLYEHVREQLDSRGWCRLQPDPSSEDALFLKCLFLPDGSYVHSYIVPSKHPRDGPYRSEFSARGLQEAYEHMVRSSFRTDVASLHQD